MTRRRQSFEERLGNVTRQMARGTLGGRVRSAARTAEPLGALQTTRPRQASEGRDYATIVVAANDSHASAKVSANYVCTGTNDETTLNDASLDAQLLMTGGRIVLLEGTYNLSGRWFVNQYGLHPLAVEGQGSGTALKVIAIPGGDAPVHFDGSDNGPCSLRNLRVDGNNVDANSGFTIPLLRFFGTSWGGFVENIIVENGGTNTGSGRLPPVMAIGPAAGNGNVITRNIVVRNCDDYAEINTSDFSTHSDWTIESSGGLYIDSCEGSVFRNFYVVDVVVAREMIFLHWNAHCVFMGLMVASTGTQSIYSEGEARCAYIGCSAIGNSGSTTGDGLQFFDGAHLLVAQAQAVLNGFDGIHLASCEDSLLVDNFASANGQSGSTVAGRSGRANFRIQDGSDRCVAQGNLARDDSPSTATDGFRVEDASSDANWVTNNDLKSSGATSFSDAGTGTITAAGNQT